MPFIGFVLLIAKATICRIPKWHPSDKGTLATWPKILVMCHPSFPGWYHTSTNNQPDINPKSPQYTKTKKWRRAWRETHQLSWWIQARSSYICHCMLLPFLSFLIQQQKLVPYRLVYKTHSCIRCTPSFKWPNYMFSTYSCIRCTPSSTFSSIFKAKSHNKKSFSKAINMTQNHSNSELL